MQTQNSTASLLIHERPSIEIFKGTESYVQNCLEVGEQSDSPDQSSITPTEDCHNSSQFSLAKLLQPKPPNT